MSEVVERIKTAFSEFQKKREALVEELKKEFPTMFNEIFEANPKLKSFGWSQYTPGFCDGDPCRFGVNNELDSLYINGERYDEQEEAEEPLNLDWRMQYVKVRNSSDEYYKQLVNQFDGEPDWGLYEAIKNIESILQSIPEEFYEDMFGDGYLVTVSADGMVNTEDYEHD